MLFVLLILYVAVFRATISGCSETNSVNGIGTTIVSLRYRIEMAQVSEWMEGGLICGMLPADCAPAKCESF